MSAKDQKSDPLGTGGSPVGDLTCGQKASLGRETLKWGREHNLFPKGHGKKIYIIGEHALKTLWGGFLWGVCLGR